MLKGEKLGPRVFGFWHYDAFPYVLGAPGRMIIAGYREGFFAADGYGGAAFRNPVTMPLKEGRSIASKLEFLKITRREKMQKMETAWLSAAKGVAPALRKLMPPL